MNSLSSSRTATALSSVALAATIIHGAAIAAEPTTAEAPPPTLTILAHPASHAVLISPLDGRRDDGPAFSAARLQATPGGEIVVGPGIFHPLSPIRGGPGDPVLWNLQGLGFGPAGVPPVEAIGHDLVENVLPGGTRYLGRGTEDRPGRPPVLRIDRSDAFDGGRLGDVTPAVDVNCNLSGRLQSFVWCNQTVVVSRAFGAGNHLAVAGSIFRPADALADGKGPRAETWAGYFENNDRTGEPSEVAGAQVGIENDVVNNGPDPLGYRILLQMNVGKADAAGAPGDVRHGVLIGANDAVSTIGAGYELAAPFTVAGFDTSAGRALRGAPAFRMAEGQRLCLDAGNRHCLAYAAGRITFSVAGRALLSLDENGGLGLSPSATDPPAASSAPGAIYLNTASYSLRLFDGRRWAFVTPQRGTPSSSHMACSPGERLYDTRFDYQCVASDKWRRERLDDF